MVSGLSEIVYSESFVAVPEIVKGIETVFPDTFESVALRVTSVDEFSPISGELSSKVTVGGLSPSFIIMSIGLSLSLVAFVIVFGVRDLLTLL